MRLDTLEDGTIVLREVFNSVVLETAEGNRLAVCMRDAGFEIGVGDSVTKDDYTWYSAGNGCVEPLGTVTIGTTKRLSHEEFASHFFAGQVVPEPLASLPYESCPRISAMLQSKTEGFFDKEKYPVPEDFVCPETPAIGSRWEIDAVYDPSRGPRNAYTVLFVTNLDHLSSKYPPQVVYRGDNGRVWSRSLGQWPGSLRRLPESVEEVERPFPQADQKELDESADAAISYGRANPIRVADGCDPEFMASLARGDHLRFDGATEEQVQKALAISRKFPFKGANTEEGPDIGDCEELVEVSPYPQDGLINCGWAAVAIVDGKPLCEEHYRKKSI